jgi:NitT/TauT family transport system substrate-binding protein
MDRQHGFGAHTRFGRRHFLRGCSLAGAAEVLGAPRLSHAEPPPETTRIRFRSQTGSICIAPQYVAEQLLHAEGFTEVRNLTRAEAGSVPEALAKERVDLSVNVLLEHLAQLDAGDPVVALAGVHGGCYELVGNERVRNLRDLKGTTLWGPSRSLEYLFVASMLAYVGLDPKRDVRWLTKESDDPKHLFLEGRTDAMLAYPPDAQEFRAKKVGHVVLDTAQDRPWSQLLCCFVFGNREFVRRHPVATKRALRAILKATDLCAQDPARAARVLVEGKYTESESYDYAVQAIREVAYNRWRTYDPDATVRFYALRLRETGFIKSSPQKILVQGTDWRFLNELKKELKA